MAIEVAADNHIGTECTPLHKSILKDLEKKRIIWQTLDEWRDSVETSFYLDHDCSGTWCCEHEGIKYGSGISVHTDDLDEDKIPAWATHVLWYSK